MPSSRKIERATYRDVAFRVLAGDQHPDHDSIAAFRQTHLAALAKLFTQVLVLCQRASLVQLGHVALDSTLAGTKDAPMENLDDYKGLWHASPALAGLLTIFLLSLIGGAVGLGLASLMSFVRISTTNFGTFSELAFGFTLAPAIVVTTLIFQLWF